MYQIFLVALIATWMMSNDRLQSAIENMGAIKSIEFSGSCAHNDLPPVSGGLGVSENAGARLAPPTAHARDDDDFSFDTIAHNADSCLSQTAR